MADKMLQDDLTILEEAWLMIFPCCRHASNRNSCMFACACVRACKAKQHLGQEVICGLPMCKCNPQAITSRVWRSRLCYLRRNKQRKLAVDPKPSKDQPDAAGTRCGML